MNWLEGLLLHLFLIFLVGHVASLVSAARRGVAAAALASATRALVGAVLHGLLLFVKRASPDRDPRGSVTSALEPGCACSPRILHAAACVSTSHSARGKR